ncbi:hypothetical protein V5O48_019133, partial [Marasmius crinis-equi]
DAFDDWIASDIIANAAARNPLSWWTSDYIKEDTWSQPLQRMALDILSCPATSCNAERGFSHSGLMMTKRRYALSSAAMQASLFPEAAIVKMFNDKSKRGEDRETLKTVIDKARAQEEAIELGESDESETSGSDN